MIKINLVSRGLGFRKMMKFVFSSRVAFYTAYGSILGLCVGLPYELGRTDTLRITIVLGLIGMLLGIVVTRWIEPADRPLTLVGATGVVETTIGEEVAGRVSLSLAGRTFVRQAESPSYEEITAGTRVVVTYVIGATVFVERLQARNVL